MTIRLAMHEASAAGIGPRLEALGLDIEILTITSSGAIRVGGRETAPEAAGPVDYVWLSTHIPSDAMGAVFAAVEALPSVGVLQTFNAGLDRPVYAKLAAKGARIVNSSAQGVAIAEYVFGQLMSVLQPIEEQRAAQAARDWRFTRFREIAGTRWLIVGYGPIGRETARRAAAFGAHVDVIRRSVEADAPVDRVGTLAELPDFLPDADVILLACPLKDETRGLAGAEFFAAAKPGAILINVARGGVVDDAALIAALDAGRIGTAILDVFTTEPLPTDSPYWDHPGVRLTAHCSNAGSGGRGRWDQLFLDNIARFARGEKLAGEVAPGDIG